jgi:hypothetical protein
MKTHLYKHLEVHFSPTGRKWVVINSKKRTTEEFLGCLAMIETYPELLSLEPIEMAYNRSLEKIQIKKQGKTNQTLVPIFYESPKLKPQPKKGSNTHVCYYCDGSGKAGYMTCSNCGGSGYIEVTSKGIW